MSGLGEGLRRAQEADALEMTAEMDESRALDKLAAALAKAQAKVEHADKSREAPVSKDGSKKRRYATLADVVDAARPHLAAHGLSVVQHPSGAAGQLILTTWLLHESGQWMRSRMAVPYSANAFMSDVQALGSAITYARRYAYAAIVGVAVEDDDGESAGRTERHEEDRSRELATPEVFPRFGPAAGQPIRGADSRHLETYANAMVGALADPERARFKAANEALLDAIRKEQERQRPSSGGQPPPQPADETKERQAGVFYAQAVRLGKDAGWEQADVGKWLKESRKRNGKTEVTAEDVEEFRKHLSPPEPGVEG